MSQSFKLKFDQMRDSDPTKEVSSPLLSNSGDEYYHEESHARTICFSWLSGRKMFMNYSYLISGEYFPDKSIIQLTFTTHGFVLKGVNLENLFYEMMAQLVKNISCIDSRYNLSADDGKFIVNEIELSKNA